MSERVWVSVGVLSKQAEEAKALIYPEQGDPSEEYEYADLTTLSYEDVRGGTIHALNSFKKHGIAFSVTCGAGLEFTEESSSLRFTAEGTAITATEFKRWPSEVLQVLLNEVHTMASVEEVLNHTRTLKACYSIEVSWDNQFEYSRKYLATQLINPQSN